MENRTKERKRQQVDTGGVAHTDFRNLPTVQLGENLTSLYITDQRIPYRRGESSSSGRSQGHDDAQRRGSTTPTARPGHVLQSGDEREEPLETQRRRRHISSNTSMENNQDDTSTASMTPSTPPSISSGKSYSGEMNDQVTPLREALPPSVSTRRRSITVDTGYGGRRNVNASSSYAALPPVRLPPPAPSAPSPPLSRRPYNMSMPSPNYNPNAGLSEILASPTFREYQTSMSPDYTASPFERPRRGNGNKSTTPKDTATAQVDYFTLPIIQDQEHDGEIERAMEQEGERPSVPRTNSITSSKSSNEARKSRHNHDGTSISTPSWSSSDVTSTRSSSLKSPRIRNEGMLAPHGSFTSDSGREFQARAKFQRARTQAQVANDNESVKSAGDGESVSSWRNKAASERSFDGSGRRQYSEEEYLENVQAARGGDQLALYHLGWGQVEPNHRHNLGDAGLVWGGGDEPGSPAQSTRSSATSRASKGSNSGSGSFPRHLSTGKSHEQILREALSRDGIPASRPNRPAHTRTQSASADLFADVAQMTLKSNADLNRARAKPQPQSQPQPPTRGTPVPGPAARPSLFKSASYVSSTNIKSSGGKGKTESAEERKIRKSRELGEGIDKDREKDPEKEREREKRRMARRAARALKVVPGAVEGSASGSNESTKKK